uniref:Snf2-related CREBBP activator protein n=1 Tax=Seriola dumerili TaxID=41447 RepID=A0A3B4U1I8_SERDU
MPQTLRHLLHLALKQALTLRCLGMRRRRAKKMRVTWKATLPPQVITCSQGIRIISNTDGPELLFKDCLPFLLLKSFFVSDSPGDSAEDEDSEKEEEESEEEEDDDCGDEGMEVLLKEGDHSPPSSSSRPKKEISHIAATAESLQPKGYTLATTKVKTPIPFLLHGTLREYQHIGLDWLVTMYEKKLNGILADEMGLGKTIQTIALLAHLFILVHCNHPFGVCLIFLYSNRTLSPLLYIVMLNWEMELKRWCPGFKILTYFGSQKERKLKRQVMSLLGWTKPNAFHVCITSYKLVLQDHQAFRRKSWRYLILDEAQNIKNFKSQRWQSLLNFNSHRRLLLTGTPLQNSLMELWSLMHFLMPHVFQSHREFKEWFSNPLTGMIEGSQEYNEGLVKRLHKVLRPFLLRRIKADVEKQMPKKYEHVVRCRLSKRQRFLYDDFMAQASNRILLFCLYRNCFIVHVTSLFIHHLVHSTRETLASGHFMSVINILMQLRKVCNHPNLFDPRPIQSPFITQRIVFHTASLVQEALDVSPLKVRGHRVLIFTQMTRMLDVLEQFLNYHGHIYLRLDGSTRVEQRQALMERFNADRRIFCFILSTRSGGVGVNLTGADTVVFYDSDWNPTMDAQAQDRCHRIGQTRDVHIYRLISERTVEENILKKANQKRMLGDMAIEGGNFTTAFFKQVGIYRESASHKLMIHWGFSTQREQRKPLLLQHSPRLTISSSSCKIIKIIIK